MIEVNRDVFISGRFKCAVIHVFIRAGTFGFDGFTFFHGDVIVFHIFVNRGDDRTHLTGRINILQFRSPFGRLFIDNRRYHGNQSQHCHGFHHQAAFLRPEFDNFA